MDMLLKCEKKVADFIKSQSIFASAHKILLAVSGGADSTALLYLMAALKTHRLLQPELFCAHINHQLRGADSDADQTFVAEQTCQLHLPLTITKVNVRACARSQKLSIETAARKLRIEALSQIAAVHNCTHIALGHQKNDNAETLLHRFLRGTGPRGLAGIWPVRSFAGAVNFARPLLCLTRLQILDYLNDRDLQWCTDRTNRNCRYKRNYIRHRLLPALQQRQSGSVIDQLCLLSQSAQRLDKLVSETVRNIWPTVAESDSSEVKLNLNVFANQHPLVKAELIRRSLAAIGSGEQNLNRLHYQALLKLAQGKTSGKMIELPGRFTAACEYGCLVFSFAYQKQKSLLHSQDIKVPGQTKLPSHTARAVVLKAADVRTERFKSHPTKLVEWFDLDKIVLPLVVRSRRPGDRFVPLGLPAEKKIGKFLTARHIPRHLRQRVLVVADREKIIWLWPLRISDLARVTPDTQRILQLRISAT